MIDFNSLTYQRSRKAYMAQCTVEYFVTLLVTDAFLAKLLTHIGVSDSLTGIISSFVSLAFVVQLMSIFLLRKSVSTKKIVIFFDTVSICFFTLLYLIPFAPFDKTVKTVFMVIGILIAYASKYLIYSICFKWANSFVEPTKRATYSANKEIISLLSGMVFTTVIGYIIDRFEEIGSIEGGFLFIAVAIFVLNVANFICLLSIGKGEKEDVEENNKTSLKEVFDNTFKNKGFRSVVLLTILWDCARYFTIGFIGVFKTNDLLMSVFLIQIVNVIANLMRMVVSKPFGRYSDKHSFAKGFKLALYIAAGGFLINCFTTKSTWFFIIIYTILYNVCLAGTNQNSFNITYNYVDEKYITQAMAFKNCIGGICGFGSALLGAKILSVIQSNGNMIFGIHVYGQQVLSLISFALTVIGIIFIRTVIEKVEVKIQ